ncbi:MAG: GPR1/FUN34/YaaH family transporter [Oscillospiraceae bacterium]|nr:GPR1/FUN34/YaaH family transporter [Oscillospiraceae bacterium]
MSEKTQIPARGAWANPTAAGLVALSVACVCFWALLTGRVGAGAMPLIGAWLFGGFIIQFVVGVLDLRSGNTAGGNTFLFFSAFFMFVSGLEMMLKYSAAASGAPLEGQLDGYVWAALTLVLWLWTPAFCKKFSMLSIVILLLDLGLPFVALTDLGILAKSYTHIAGWAMLASGAVAIYLCSAMVINATYGKKLYPVF